MDKLSDEQRLRVLGLVKGNLVHQCYQFLRTHIAALDGALWACVWPDDVFDHDPDAHHTICVISCLFAVPDAAVDGLAAGGVRAISTWFHHALLSWCTDGGGCAQCTSLLAATHSHMGHQDTGAANTVTH